MASNYEGTEHVNDPSQPRRMSLISSALAGTKKNYTVSRKYLLNYF